MSAISHKVPTQNTEVNPYLCRATSLYQLRFAKRNLRLEAEPLLEPETHGDRG